LVIARVVHPAEGLEWSVGTLKADIVSVGEERRIELKVLEVPAKDTLVFPTRLPTNRTFLNKELHSKDTASSAYWIILLSKDLNQPD
jgi:hypothetical protein